jgi:hypothetical protein
VNRKRRDVGAVDGSIAGQVAGRVCCSIRRAQLRLQESKIGKIDAVVSVEIAGQRVARAR